MESPLNLNDSCPSDTDLSVGLPSPDASDDEDLNQNQDLGIVVPNFCNKLRKLTQHLFPKPEAVVLSDLCGQGILTVKNETKKKTFKDEADVLRRPVTSHSGYHSSPRWDTKSPSMRSYDPCDITGGDELEVAGVLFKSWTASRDKQKRLSKSEFPSLNESSLSERSEMSKSNDTSLLGLSNLSSSNQMNRVAQSPSVKNGLSPVTSTPHSKNRNNIQQESPLPHNPESPLCGNQSLKKSGSKSNRRRSKKYNNPVEVGCQYPSLESSPKVDINANNSFQPKCMDDRQKQQALDFEDVSRNSIVQCQKSKPQQQGIMGNEISNDTRTISPSWNNIVKSSSPRLSPIMRIDSPRNYLQPGDHNPLSKEEPKPIEIVRKRDDFRNPLSNDQPPVPISAKKKTKEKVRVSLMSVDTSCVTPKKKNEADAWSTKSNTAFENRFVEKIAVSSTSPPKKVNPSPIKKLDFSQRRKDSSSSVGEEREIKAPVRTASLFTRQMSLISDLDWKKGNLDNSNNNNKGHMRGNKNEGGKEKNGRGKKAVFSLEDFVKTQKVANSKDEICDVEAGEDKGRGGGEAKTKIGEFWTNKSTGQAEEMTTHGSRADSEGGQENGRKIQAKFEGKRNSLSPNSMIMQGTVTEDVTQVTYKSLLRVCARRYCYYLEGHHVTNVSKELLFIVQLLTCSDEDCLSLIHLAGSSIFESVHNCIYFAVLVMKRLKRLFSCLPKQTICLIAINHRVKAFSPKLHQFFKALVRPKENHPEKEDVVTENLSESNVIGSCQNWSSTFSDVKMVHAFKCQRDNFFALYQRYQEADKGRPFPMEEQLHYVYNPQISEHKSIVNLMHLAQLFLDLLLRSSMQHSNDQVNYLEMVVNGKPDSDDFQKTFEKWRESNSALKLGSPPGWNRNELFFKDFLKAIRCPAFNDITRNMIVSKILELNNSGFECLTNLHSSVCVPDDKTPQRCEQFTMTVYRLCILSKFLGFLVFDSYSGAEDLSAEENQYMFAVREMTPLPLPLPMLLKTACDKGHLSLTVPWVVQYLSMMDAGAVKLTAYSQMLHQLSSIHRHAWENLFHKGHNNAGLLVTSCITWLFENPILPAGFIYSHESKYDCSVVRPEAKILDTQRLVTSHLLYSCCPYLNAGHIPLVLFALNQRTVSSVRNIVPLTPASSKLMPVSTAIIHRETNKDVDELCSWLGVSLHTGVTSHKSETTDRAISSEEIAQSHGDQMIVPSVCNRLAENSLDVLTTNFLQCHPYLSHCIHQSVDMMCGKVEQYTLSTLLKLAVFDARVKVRRKFMNMDAGEDANSMKSHILANSNIMADKISRATKQAFFDTGERVCQTELPSLIHFLASHMEEAIRDTAVAIAQKSAMSRLLEWAQIQLGADVFRKVLIQEVEKLASKSKSCNLYPSDYLRKPEYSGNPIAELSSSGFVHLQQLSKVLDTALACGSWYMNGQTRGPRPDDVFFQGLMEDFMDCVRNHSVSLDFSFSIMVNFFMHLIIQYIVDAPHNWTDSCQDTFVNLCILFEAKKSEDDRISFQPIESSHKAKNMQMKVTNMISVYSLEWLSTSHAVDHSLMVYCNTLVKLIAGGLVSVERTVEKLTSTRVNHNLHTVTKLQIDRIMVKVLELLYTGKYESFGCNLERVVATAQKTLGNLTDWVSENSLKELQATFGSSADIALDGE